MQLHQLKPIHKLKKRKRVGRGGKRGTYSGRGNKGQKSRSGANFQPVVRELIKRYPKLRGYRFNLKLKNRKSKIVILNLKILEEKFKPGEEITPERLLAKKIIAKIKRKVPKVKILGDGKLTKALTVKNCLVSKQAEDKIKKAGGTVK